MERRGKEGEGSYPVVIDEMEEDPECEQGRLSGGGNHPGDRKL